MTKRDAKIKAFFIVSTDLYSTAVNLVGLSDVEKVRTAIIELADSLEDRAQRLMKRKPKEGDDDKA